MIDYIYCYYTINHNKSHYYTIGKIYNKEFSARNLQDLKRQVKEANFKHVKYFRIYKNNYYNNHNFYF